MLEFRPGNVDQVVVRERGDQKNPEKRDGQSPSGDSTGLRHGNLQLLKFESSMPREEECFGDRREGSKDTTLDIQLATGGMRHATGADVAYLGTRVIPRGFDAALPLSLHSNM